jgi:hypothetical protein
MGTQSASGILQTMEFCARAGQLIIETDALGWSPSECNFNIFVNNISRTFTCQNEKTISLEFERFTNNLTVANSIINVTFQTPQNKRIFLDNLRILNIPDNPPSTIDFFLTSNLPSIIPSLSELKFKIIAMENDVIVPVNFNDGLPTGATYSFENNQFSWTPLLNQHGTYQLNFSAINGEGIKFNYAVPIEVTPIVLTSPQNLEANDINATSFKLSWTPVPAAIDGYRVNIWHGSASTNTATADCETFFEISDSGKVVAPNGWQFHGVNEKYVNATCVELKFDNADDTVVTKIYPVPVTKISFMIKGRSTNTALDSRFELYGADNKNNWILLKSYSTLADSDGDDENNIFSTNTGDLTKEIVLNRDLNIRQFKFVYANKAQGNLGLSNITVEYEGCGVKFLPVWHNQSVTANNLDIVNTPCNRELFAQVSAVSGAQQLATTIRLATLPVSKQGVIIIK